MGARSVHSFLELRQDTCLVHLPLGGEVLVFECRRDGH